MKQYITIENFQRITYGTLIVISVYYRLPSPTILVLSLWVNFEAYTFIINAKQKIIDAQNKLINVFMGYYEEALQQAREEEAKKEYEDKL